MTGCEENSGGAVDCRVVPCFARNKKLRKICLEKVDLLNRTDIMTIRNLKFLEENE